MAYDAKVQNQVMGATHGYGAIEVGDKTYIFSHGDNTGFTRSLVDSYLMTNGLPIYASEGAYQGDKNLKSTMENRDLRLVTSVAKPGDKIMTLNGKDIMYQYPGLIAASGIRVTSTGYIPRKGWADNNVTYNSAYPLALPIFRAAEAYLNYIERTTCATIHWKMLPSKNTGQHCVPVQASILISRRPSTLPT